MQSRNGLKLSAKKARRYCQTQLCIIRDEIEDTVGRAFKKGYSIEALGYLILDSLDERIEKLESETVETMFDAETLNVSAVEIYVGVLVVSWDCNIGFGQCVFTYDNHTQKWSVESERMSEDFVRALLDKTFETLVLT